MMNTISSFAIPAVILIILSAGLIKKVPVYDNFLAGAGKGLETGIGIIPPLIGLVSAVTMFRASGAPEILYSFVSPAAEFLGFPKEVVPLALLRPVSGSASIAVLRDIFSSCGADSFAGRVASVMSGSTETTLYTVTLYFGAVRIKNTRYTLKSALMADFTSYIAAVTAVKLLLN